MKTSDQLYQIFLEYKVLLPEVVLASTAILILLMGTLRFKNRILDLFFLLGLVLAYHLIPGSSVISFFDQLQNSELTYFAKKLLVLATGAILFYRSGIDKHSEYLFLLLSVLLGSFLMISANNLLLLYVSIELVSFGSYFLTGLLFRKTSIEGAFKYYLFGAVSSGVMLFGISMYYGGLGSLTFMPIDTLFSEVGLMLVLVGLFFKASIAPFHFWAPNAYQVSSSSVVAFLTIVPKIAALLTFYHLAKTSFTEHVSLVTVGIATLSVIVGTFSAIKQSNVKRLLAYGSVAHSGFLLILVLIDNQMFNSSFRFYSFVYATMNLGVFYLISLFEQDKDLTVSDFSGLGRIHPLIGVYFLILMVSLIGLPPTGGFTAKLFLFTSVWMQYTMSENAIWMIFFIVGILASAVSLFYYLRIPYYYFLKESDTGSAGIFRVQILFATIFVLMVLLVFIDPNILDIFV